MVSFAGIHHEYSHMVHRCAHPIRYARNGHIMPTDAYLGNGNEGHDSDDYVPYYADYEYEENLPLSMQTGFNPDTPGNEYDARKSDKDWFTTPSGNKCPWCKDGLSSPFEPEDEDDAEMSLCRGHAAEYAGLSLEGMDRRDSEEMYDQL
jgi:hypothetical protein